jgi:hypothetical protein
MDGPLRFGEDSSQPRKMGCAATWNDGRRRIYVMNNGDLYVLGHQAATTPP